MLFANSWAIGSDEGLYNNVCDSVPKWWLENPELPNIAAFRYGRRACPGKVISMDSLSINIARVLWGYEFAHGERKVALWDINHTFTSTLRDFDAKFSIRSAKHHETFENAWSVAILMLMRFLQRSRRLEGIANTLTYVAACNMWSITRDSPQTIN